MSNSIRTHGFITGPQYFRGNYVFFPRFHAIFLENIDSLISQILILSSLNHWIVFRIFQTNYFTSHIRMVYIKSSTTK